ncbi:MAG: peptidylprolyl isomerase [Acidimicrobiales bacterium]|nr:peptidylprolyl isomerase [Acidimicrobiales bacterium]
MSIRTPRNSRLGAVAVALALVLMACGTSDPLDGTVVKDGLGCSPSETERSKTAPTIAKVAKAPTKVGQKDLEKGKGCPTDTVNFLTLDLIGATATDGKVFTDTWKDGRPVTAKLGTGQLLPALDTALGGLKVGGRRQITLPAADAYGKDGNDAQGIGPDQALTFVVELVAVTDTPLYCNAGAPIAKGKAEGKPTKVEMPVKPPAKLKTTDLKVGTGDAAEKGNYATVHYLGVACSTGMQFDSSWDNGESFPVTLGEGTIPGFYEGIYGMKVGGVRQIDIPADQAYGAAGQGSIAPNEPLVFIIELKALADTPPTTTTVAPESTTTVAPAATTTTAAGAATTSVAPAGATTTTAAEATTTTAEQ